MEQCQVGAHSVVQRGRSLFRKDSSQVKNPSMRNAEELDCTGSLVDSARSMYTSGCRERDDLDDKILARTRLDCGDS